MLPVIVPEGQLHLSEIQETNVRVFEQKRFTAPSTFTFFLLFCPLFSLLSCLLFYCFFRKSPSKYALAVEEEQIKIVAGLGQNFIQPRSQPVSKITVCSFF